VLDLHQVTGIAHPTEAYIGNVVGAVKFTTAARSPTLSRGRVVYATGSGERTGKTRNLRLRHETTKTLTSR